MDKEKFAVRLRQLRKERHITQDALAEKLKLTKQAVSQWERGIREPNFETLEMIADYFNVDTDYLIGREDHTTLLLNGDEHKLVEHFRNLSPEYREAILQGPSSPIPPAEMAHLEKYRALDAEDQDTVDALTENLLAKSKYHTEEDSGQTGAA